ncbi:hypothetical protein GCM10023185_01350 [Hymenobacter saemangeumensis]|uniref:SGNH/GDSL hydrolase family protein n=1 Tax=Hymenobacter saemangeumensis TaxID=1084522 RepID=A0ABP8HXG5_9BACT
MTAFRVTKSTFLAGLTAAAALVLNSCAPGQDNPTPSAGTLDLSRYLAVGDTYTAGISNGGLTRTSQSYSYPSLMARQFRLVSPNATFEQPLLNEGSGSGYLRLIDVTPLGLPRVQRVPGQAVRGQIINPNACGGADTIRVLERNSNVATLPQNLGIPGLRLGQIGTANLGNQSTATPGSPFNPYFERLLPANTNSSYLQAVTTAAGSATFFTYFLGLDDLMPFVRSGGICATPLIGTTIRNNIKNVLDRLTANNRRGIIARIPNPTSLPLLRLGQGLALQTRLQAQSNDQSPLYIESTTNGTRLIGDTDYVLATAIPRIGRMENVSGTMVPYGRDMRNPIRTADVLDDYEVSIVTLATNNINNELERLAKDVYRMPIYRDGKYTLNLPDELFNQIAGEIAVNGVVYTGEPVRGNFYSLDYYSLTPRGNALLANTFIRAINQQYRTSIPALDVNSMPTTVQ